MKLDQMGIEDDRLNAEGNGENMPVADNSTAAGRQQNRRVEVAIFATEELVERAREGNLEPAS